MAAWMAIPALVMASIWLPVVRHYQIPDPRITLEVIEQARRNPPQSLLEELRGERLLVPDLVGDEVIEAAEDLLRGRLRLGGQPAIRFRLPFHAEDLEAGTAVTRLYVAGLTPADLLLQAYEITGQERFLSSARTLIVEFARYESSASWPRGLLWNDHAAANRVFVLSDFWRVYRRRPDFDIHTARAILTLAGRSGELLALPHQFAFGGNHGVMQNIGLLRLRLGFPSLPKSGYYHRLAMERLGDQLSYYVSDGGVVLEHSAEYQFFGIAILRLAFRYGRLLKTPVPVAWERKLARAERFAAQLPRPDGTLPVYGDTSLSANTSTSRAWARERDRVEQSATQRPRPSDPVTWDPVAGYAILWDGLERWPEARGTRQTVVTFSYFPGHSHKHADELSVLLWAGGQTWWTDVGYWPYDSPERPLTEAWNGSSAPHLMDEPARSERVPRGLFLGVSETAVMLEAAREGPGTYRVRRQVIHVKPNIWLVIDAVSGAPDRVSVTRWTTGRGILLRDGQVNGSYALSMRGGPARLFASYLGSPGMTVRTLRKTLGPFLGTGAKASQADVTGIEVTQPGDDSWAAAVWRFDEDGTIAAGLQPKITSWRGPEDWRAVLPGGEWGPLEISRLGNRVAVSASHGPSETIILENADASSQRQDIIRAFRRAAAKYPRPPLRLRYRQLSTYALIGALLVQELSLLAIARWAAGLYRRLRFLTVPLWILGGVVLAVGL